MTGARRISAQVKFLADQNFNDDIVEYVTATDPSIDILHVRHVGMDETQDPDILEWAAQQDRVVLSHDVNTMRSDAYDRVIAGLPMPELFLVVKGRPLEQVAQDIVLLAVSSIEGEWENQVKFLPLQ